MHASTDFALMMNACEPPQTRTARFCRMHATTGFALASSQNLGIRARTGDLGSSDFGFKAIVQPDIAKGAPPRPTLCDTLGSPASAVEKISRVRLNMSLVLNLPFVFLLFAPGFQIRRRNEV